MAQRFFALFDKSTNKFSPPIHGDTEINGEKDQVLSVSPRRKRHWPRPEVLRCLGGKKRATKRVLTNSETGLKYSDNSFRNGEFRVPLTSETRPERGRNAGRIGTQFLGGSALLSAHHVEPDGGDKYRAFDDVLHEIADVEQRHSIVEGCHDQGAEARAKDRAAAADE